MGVLLLNATYEPLRIITVRRAVVLVLQDKAEVIEAQGEIHSANVSLPRPDVIRLKYFVKIPFKSKVPLTNKAVLNRDRFKCMLGHNNKKNCLGVAKTVDHIHPRSRGGKHEWTNVVAACKNCNSKKAAKTLEELGWTINVNPGPPTAKTWLVVGSAEKREEWSEWLKHTS